MSPITTAILGILATFSQASASQGEGSGGAQDAAPEVRLVGPRTGEEQSKALRKNGGSARTEAAVVAGLDWLARHQQPEGGWDADGFEARCTEVGACPGIGKGQHGEEVPCPFDESITGLAALAFLGHGHHPGSEDAFSGVVEHALARIAQPRDAWTLAISTQAHAEAAVLGAGARYAERARALAARLLALRNEDGAWGYASRFRPGSDVPFTALAIQALVTSRDVGFVLPENLGDEVDTWLDSLEEDEGSLAYLVNGRAYGYTPTTSNAHCAAAIRELLETGLKGRRHRAHHAKVAATPPEWKIGFRDVEVPGRGTLRVQTGHLSMYQWWYGTVASFQKGGATWRKWSGRLNEELLGAQREKGCARGSWDPEGTYERQTGGRVFATALGVLMLEQSYRHQRLLGR